MSEPLTFKDLADFVFANKTNKVFTGCTDNEILSELKSALYHQTLFFHTNPEGKIVGMIIAIKDDEKKSLFVTRNLAMSLSVLKLFAKKAIKTWPDYTLQWRKNGNLKNHNTDKFYKKLLS